MRVFGIDMYTLNGPEAFERVFVNQDKVFASGPAWSHFIGPFFNRGLMLLDFEEHLHHRRIMQHAFGAEQLRRYNDLMIPHIQKFLGEWADVEKPQLQRMFKDLTLDLALEVFVGVELEAAERQRINKAFIQAVRGGTSIVRRDLPRGIGPWSQGTGRPQDPREVLLRPCPPSAATAATTCSRGCARPEDDEGNRFSDEDVVNHMIFLLMAAHDTTTTTLTSMAYEVAKHPEWQERCRREALSIDDTTYDALQGMTDTDLVMKEAMRLCAPVPSIPRYATREVVIDGYRIPEGAVVSNSPYANHYLEDVWPDPTRFDPERFSPERHEDKVHRLAFQAFGAGVHKCIGMYFAGMQVRAVFHELLRTYQWSVPADYVMPIDLAALPVPRDGLPVTLEKLP